MVFAEAIEAFDYSGGGGISEMNGKRGIMLSLIALRSHLENA